MPVLIYSHNSSGSCVCRVRHNVPLLQCLVCTGAKYCCPAQVWLASMSQTFTNLGQHICLCCHFPALSFMVHT